MWFLSWCFYPFQHFQFSCVVPVLGGGSDLIGGKYSETIKQFTTPLQLGIIHICYVCVHSQASTDSCCTNLNCSFYSIQKVVLNH